MAVNTNEGELGMEVNISKIIKDGIVMENVTFSGSVGEVTEFINTFGVTPTGTTSPKKPDIEYTDEDIEYWASRIDLRKFIVEGRNINKDDYAAILEWLPTHVEKYKKLDSHKAPKCVLEAYDSVCAYTFNSWVVDKEKGLEYTIAKFNKEAYGRIGQNNIIKIYKINGRYVVLLSQYPIRNLWV